jgi:hypothetical protein
MSKINFGSDIAVAIDLRLRLSATLTIIQQKLVDCESSESEQHHSTVCLVLLNI